MLTLAAYLLSPSVNSFTCQIGSGMRLQEINDIKFVFQMQALWKHRSPSLCNVHLFPVFGEEEMEEGRELAKKGCAKTPLAGPWG